MSSLKYQISYVGTINSVALLYAILIDTIYVTFTKILRISLMLFTSKRCRKQLNAVYEGKSI